MAQLNSIKVEHGMNELVFCVWRFAIPVTLLNIFSKLLLKGFLEAFARGLEFLNFRPY